MRLHTLLVLLVLPSALVVVYLQSLYAQRSDFADTSRSRDALTKARVQDQLQAAAAQAQLQMGIAQGERQLQARVQAQLRAASTGPMRVPW
jgi:tRNA C32,U32 (ribose-2'-O)-methylase TrmJ